MSYFKELDILIQDKCKYNPDTRENEASYLQFKDEIELHLSGELTYEQLSPIAQDTIAEWEGIVEAMAHRDYMNYAEQPEDF